MLGFTTLPNTDRQVRLYTLKVFFDHAYFDRFIDGLKSIADQLPKKFVNSFLLLSGSGAARSASLRKRFDTGTLLTRIEKSAFFQPTFDPVNRLALVLQHAFVPGAPSRLLLRHHVFISGLTPVGLPLLKQLKGPAAKQVRLLFGDADSLDTLELDEAQANHVRCLPSEEHHRA
ncbi:uncharacterized protein UBRO_20464 [Ustilago bromivora]|uniref:Uncharacterized protein n=1 Tax=Ustilago bromivora TaxID=307758 RepID=A0A1K0FX89_9BASI|nr:uncharacterized protein UBRO_20464 [Ustilago bromivora]